jgi:hypothetical protein
LTLPEQLVWAAVFGSYYEEHVTIPVRDLDMRQHVTLLAARRATEAVDDLRRVKERAGELLASEPEVAEAVREMAWPPEKAPGAKGRR